MIYRGLFCWFWNTIKSLINTVWYIPKRRSFKINSTSRVCRCNWFILSMKRKTTSVSSFTPEHKLVFNIIMKNFTTVPTVGQLHRYRQDEKMQMGLTCIAQINDRPTVLPSTHSHQQNKSKERLTSKVIMEQCSRVFSGLQRMVPNSRWLVFETN